MGRKNTVGLVVLLIFPLDSSKIIKEPLLLVWSCGAEGLAKGPQQSAGKISEGGNATHGEERAPAQGGSR